MQFEVFEEEAGKWRWRMVSRTGRLVSISRDRFPSETDCRQALDRVKAALGPRLEQMDD